MCVYLCFTLLIHGHQVLAACICVSVCVCVRVCVDVNVRMYIYVIINMVVYARKVLNEEKRDKT